jgi:hypothetical protein
MIPLGRNNMDQFTRQYLVTALWSSIAADDEPMDRETPDRKPYSISDIADETVAQAESDCAKFQRENAADLAVFEEAFDSEKAAYCLWLDRNGAGTGFWDRDVSSALFDRIAETLTVKRRSALLHRIDVNARVSAAAEALAERLSKAASAMGETPLYEGDDGKIYA